MAQYVLKLYIAGLGPESRQAIETLERLCADAFPEQYELKIIDVIENPQLAEDERILATPMVAKELPPPLRRVIGDLSDRTKVLLGLDLRSRDESDPASPH